MEEILELIKNTDGYKTYVDTLVNNQFPLSPSSEEFLDNPIENGIKKLNINKEDNKIVFSAGDIIGGDGLHGGKAWGFCAYNAVLQKSDADLVLFSGVRGRITHESTEGLDPKPQEWRLDEKVVDELYTDKFEGLGYLYPEKEEEQEITK